MNKCLVAYFSASGVTADAAEKIAKAVGAELYEIRPKVPYTKEDLNWEDKTSRSSVEMTNKNIRPAIADKTPNVSGYDTVFLGFPVWWYTAPTIINTYLESCDFSGIRIILFATSGSSGFENSLSDLRKSVSSKTEIEEGIVVHGVQPFEYWNSWVSSLSL